MRNALCTRITHNGTIQWQYRTAASHVLESVVYVVFRRCLGDNDIPTTLQRAAAAAARPDR